jgi:SAM-dependent methyltransferase
MNERKTPIQPSAPGSEDLRWSPIIWPDQDLLIPPRSLWVGPKDPVVHFFRWPWEYRAYLVLLCKLAPHSSVLELGCNHGRTALGLLDYVVPPGNYDGLDIMPEQIRFAQNNIQTRYPHFHFSLADIHNQIYNPKGRLNANSFVFPYEAQRFDVIYAASLFTHLMPDAVDNYFKQSRRVLKPGGTCLFSFFVLDHYGGPGTSRDPFYEFNHQWADGTDVAVHDVQRPEQLIAYRHNVIETIARAHDLRVVQLLPGYWSSAHRLGLNEQDLVVLTTA